MTPRKKDAKRRQNTPRRLPRLDPAARRLVEEYFAALRGEWTVFSGSKGHGT